MTPENRIKWFHSPVESDNENLAKADKKVLSNWETGKISTKEAIKEIKKNNKLKSLSEEDFIENARSLGYIRVGA